MSIHATSPSAQSAPETELLARIDGLKSLIDEHARKGDDLRTLPREILDALHSAGVFRMVVPRSLGGLEASPPTVFEAIRRLGNFDGSTAWCAFINGGGPFIGAQMPDTLAEQIWSDPRGVIAGSVFPPGKAIATDGGYLVSGHWTFASGCRHSTWMIAFCRTFDGGQPRLAPHGGPEMRVAVFPSTEAKILDTWDVIGLEGTGSFDFEFADHFVPEEHSFVFGAGTRGCHYQSALYAFPFLGVFGFPMAAVALGVAQAAIGACLDLAASKVPRGGEITLRERPLFQHQLADAVATVESAWSWIESGVASIWRTVEGGEPVSIESRTRLLLSAAHGTRSAARAAELMYLAGGGSSVYRSNRLQKFLRDVLAISQHTATNPQQIENAGHMLAGFSPVSPLVVI